jgi:hypothetical protein
MDRSHRAIDFADQGGYRSFASVFGFVLVLVAAALLLTVLFVQLDEPRAAARPQLSEMTIA